MIAVPPVVFAAVGIPNAEGIFLHRYGVLAGSLVLGYCILEEARGEGICKMHWTRVPRGFRLGSWGCWGTDGT